MSVASPPLDEPRKTSPMSSMYGREAELENTLVAYPVLDEASRENLDRITRLAMDLFCVSIAQISLIGPGREWTLVAAGEPSLDGYDDSALLRRVTHDDQVLIVQDTRTDRRFAEDDPGTRTSLVRFYAAALVRDENDVPAGALCIADHQPRETNHEDSERLILLAGLVRREINRCQRATGTKSPGEAKTDYDPITKARWKESFCTAFDRAQRAEKQRAGFVFCMVLIENLRFINDALGRATGDEVLAETARRLRQAGRAFGLLELVRLNSSRIGLAVECGGLLDTPERLRRAVAQAFAIPYSTQKGPVSPNIKIGISAGTFEPDGLSNALHRCRIAIGSSAGKGHVQSAVFSQCLEQSFSRKTRIGADLPLAISGNELYLAYQPKVNASKGSLEGFECLLRWAHPELGQLPPNEIIEAARNLNRLVELEKRLVECALAQTAEWSRQGLWVNSVSVNLTETTLLDAGFRYWLQDAIARHKVAPWRLDIEIVESSLFHDLVAAERVMSEIASMGVTFSLDDFGTGYSSLAYLKRLPVSAVKIDKSFVEHIIDDPSDAALCAGIISLARDLGIVSVAEGIETQTQYHVLRAYRCDVLQGFFFSRPLPADAAMDVARARAWMDSGDAAASAGRAREEDQRRARKAEGRA